MGRLVIGVHLPYHRLAVLVVEPKARHIVGGTHSRGINTDVLTAANHNLLAPVAYQVALEARSILRPVVHVAA